MTEEEEADEVAANAIYASECKCGDEYKGIIWNGSDAPKHVCPAEPPELSDEEYDRLTEQFLADIAEINQEAADAMRADIANSGTHHQ